MAKSDPKLTLRLCPSGGEMPTASELPAALVALARLLARQAAREALVASDRGEGEQDDG